jgi:hypothetical protein
MVVAPRFEGGPVHSNLARAAFSHRTNSRQTKRFETLRNLPPRRNSEEQLVVFAAVQRLI